MRAPGYRHFRQPAAWRLKQTARLKNGYFFTLDNPWGDFTAAKGVTI
jgi:hypothetical protein